MKNINKNRITKSTKISSESIRFFCFLFLPLLYSVPAFFKNLFPSESSHQAITCWKLTIKTLEQGVKYVQN